MSKNEAVEGVEEKRTRVAKPAHPLQAFFTQLFKEACRSRSDITSVMVPSQFGLGGGRYAVMVQTTRGEWLRVDIKVSAADVYEES